MVIAGAGINLTLLRYGLGAEGMLISLARLEFICKVRYSYLESVHKRLTDNFLQLSFIIGITYALSLNLAKLTILQMYLQIFQVHNTRIWIMILAAVSTATCVANIFTIIFQCSPVDKAWALTKPGKCINIQDAYAGFGIVNIVLDILIPIVPAFGVAKLQGDLRRRTLGIIMLVLGSA